MNPSSLDRILQFLAASTMATMPARTVSCNSGQAATMMAKSGSSGIGVVALSVARRDASRRLLSLLGGDRAYPCATQHLWHQSG